MQDLESQVVDVCKQGFAELQKNDALALSGHSIDPRPFGSCPLAPQLLLCVLLLEVASRA